MKPRPIFSICHTTARPQGWQQSFNQWMKNAVMPGQVEYVLCVDTRWGFPVDYDPDLRIKTVYNDGARNSVCGWNRAAAASSGSIIILNSDDMFPQLRWDEELLATILTGASGQVVVRTRHRLTDRDEDNWLIACQIMTRQVYERWGYALYPGYISMCCDNDFTLHAEQDGIVVTNLDILIEHRHPVFNNGQFDAVYRHENDDGAYEVGRELLKRRIAEKFS